MQNIVRISPPTADDDEVAAIATALSRYLDKSDETQRQAEKPVISSWKAASLLESTARSSPVISPLPRRIRKRLWSAAKLPNILSVISSLLLSASLAASAPAPAQAQDAKLPPVAPDTVTGTESLMPPYAAPAASTSKTQQQLPGFRRWQQPPALLRPPIPCLAKESTDQQSNSPDGIGSANRVSADAAIPDNPASKTAISDRLSSVGPVATPAMPAIVRVALANNVSTAAIALPDGATLKDANSGKVLAELPPQTQWQVAVRAPGGYRQLCFAGRTSGSEHARVMIAARNHYRNVGFVSGLAPTNLVALPAGRAPQFWLPFEHNSELSSAERSYVLMPPSEGTIGLSGKLYRGSLLIRPATSATAPAAPNPNSRYTSGVKVRTGNGFNVINYLYVEDYLLSVVPSEMPSGWPIEALKAQAIAARSFVLANSGRHESEGYDVTATTQDQVYTGVGPESDNSNRAVAETSGQVLKHNGNIITAYFHSASGGYTETCENVWNKPMPYLKAVADYDDDSPHFCWTRSFNSNDAAQALVRTGKGVGAVLAIMPVARGISPRVRWLLVAGTDRTLYISGEQARKIFSLPSSLFNVGGTNGRYVFAGRGFGHGLGMSQWGAKKLAELGYSAPQILTYYYKDVTLERF